MKKNIIQNNKHKFLDVKYNKKQLIDQKYIMIFNLNRNNGLIEELIK